MAVYYFFRSYFKFLLLNGLVMFKGGQNSQACQRSKKEPRKKKREQMLVYMHEKRNRIRRNEQKRCAKNMLIDVCLISVCVCERLSIQ